MIDSMLSLNYRGKPILYYDQLDMSTLQLRYNAIHQS